MFITAPLAPRARLRTVPLATVFLVSANLAAASWTAVERAPLAGERDTARAASVVPEADTSRLATLRRAALGAELAAIDARDPVHALSYERGSLPARAVSALFVHATAMHVLTNVLVLAVAGACLEQVWGPAIVLALFVGAGTAGLVLDARCGGPGLLVGASSGVAALLGACFVRFRRRSVAFGFVHLEYLRPRWGRFQLPVAVLGLAWLVVQAMGAIADSSGGHSGVAFVAHLAGAGAGIGTALLVAPHPRSRPVETTQLS